MRHWLRPFVIYHQTAERTGIASCVLLLFCLIALLSA